jgi:uncharacterized protein
MLAIAERAGGRLVNQDRMWHYTEGIENWNPIWARHGIRILPGPSSLWLDARGQRFPAPNFPGFDTLGTLGAIRESGYDYSWFVLTQRIATPAASAATGWPGPRRRTRSSIPRPGR